MSEEGNPAVNLSHATSIDTISFRAVEQASFRVLLVYLAACEYKRELISALPKG